MANKTVHLPMAHVGETLRKDAWWVGPAVTVFLLSSFVVYATWRTFEGSAYEYEAYLSPFYSPLFDVGWAKGMGLGFVTPAMLILPGPLSFRLTCYYYRKAYYRAFAWDPPACAVGERAAHRYNGETKLLSSRTCTGSRSTWRSLSSLSCGRTRSSRSSGGKMGCTSEWARW